MCRHALDRYENIVVVLPTGGGKSMLWDVPVQSDGEKNMTTIVLAPYISLLYDQARRSEKKGIKHAIWKQKGKNREEQYQLMFGSYENIGSTAFRSYLHQDESVISRVVLDEAPTILTEISFRSYFKKANMWQQYTFPQNLCNWYSCTLGLCQPFFKQQILPQILLFYAAPLSVANCLSSCICESQLGADTHHPSCSQRNYQDNLQV
ncbi:hypothetical protein QCA50_010064 [Cerrena zonata]|uniref:DEAD/DEAH-box helicase domain-containing protein n=1 Tax=Cerrena zonata TaxID=2478898 RepID=A0AAW0FY77_9APHY